MARQSVARTRSAETSRAAILAAARQRFAADGYERATVRAIAGDVGIDPAMVIRYFGNKEKLFAEAADFDLRLPDLSAVPRTKIGVAIVAHFIERWEEDDTFMALVRTAATHEAAASRVRAVLSAQVTPTIAKLSGDSARAPERAGLVASQLLGMALCRYVLKLPPLIGMSRAEVLAWVGPTVLRYVTGKPGAAAQQPRRRS